jgi:hypothetical protein
MDVSITYIDAQNLIIESEKTFQRNFKVKNFEIPSNSLNDNIVSTRELKRFSKRISNTISGKIIKEIENTAYTQVSSKLLPTLEVKHMDGQFFNKDIEDTEDFIKQIRKNNFKQWIKERVLFN